ncbi:MAG: hypothetical protein HF314_04385 [Ignavibacteria bacterium]|jgi:hypothetical protein|nr:hypothetical protein [Ignavibacteria bacterium]MCU7502288.1 hypothetical protein [Ignavibacteria bacterium]MCU7516668.1 hypothetical protein [Ignavibacteria bacterium]
MKKNLLILAILFSSILLNAQDFRNAKWGSLPEEVKRTENARLIKEEDGLLVYSGHIDGKLASIWYLFSNSGLYKINIKFQVDKGQDYLRCVDTHVRLISLFTNKYGIPEEGIAPWVRKYASAGRDKRREIMSQMMKEEMTSDLTWKSGTSKIELSLKLSGEFKPVHSLTYTAL